MKKLLFFAAFALLFGADKSYFYKETPQFKLIFTQDDAQKADEFIAYFGNILTAYTHSFNQPLYVKPTIVFASNHHQMANGYAFSSPFTFSKYYPTGSLDLDEFPSPSWTKLLALHETSHIFQLHAKPASMRALESVFGSLAKPILVPPFLPILPVFITPNNLLPTFFLEGNAILNESSHGNGGRLYSAHNKALFLSLLKAGRLNLARLYNEHESFPFTGEKYIVGSFYFAFLAQKYGTERANGFFRAHSEHWINPFLISQTAMSHFGKSIDELFWEFLNFFAPQADALKEQSGRVLATSLIYAPLSRQNDESFFVASDLKSYPRIYTLSAGGARLLRGQDLSANTGQDLEQRAGAQDLKIQSGDFHIGKVFKLDGEFYTRSSGRLGADKIVAGLWNGEQALKKDTAGLVVQDFCADKMAYFKAAGTFDSAELFIDGKSAGAVNSGAMFDEACNYYYFRQDGRTRALYKNGARLFGFDGWDAKLADVRAGKVYFVAPSQFGSALFVYDGKISRLGAADNIIDAKALGGDEFLLSTVSSSGYRILTAKLSPQTGEPVLWRYRDLGADLEKGTKIFGASGQDLRQDLDLDLGQNQSTDLRQDPSAGGAQDPGQDLGADPRQDLRQDARQDPSTAARAQNLRQDQARYKMQAYNHLTNLRYAGLHPEVATSAKAHDVKLNLAFKDELDQNALTLNYQDKKAKSRAQALGLKYENTRYDLNFAITYQRFLRDASGARKFFAQGLAQYPLYAGSRQSLRALASKYYEQEYSAAPFFGGLEFSHRVIFGLSNFAYRNFKLGAYAGERGAASVNLAYSESFWDAINLKTNFKFSSSSAGGLKLSSAAREFNPINKNFYDLRDDIFAKDLASGQAGADLALNFSLYSAGVLSLKNVILKGGYEYARFSPSFDGRGSVASAASGAAKNLSGRKNLSETSAGAEFILLFGRKFTMPLEILYVKNSLNKDSNVLFNFGGNF